MHDTLINTLFYIEYAWLFSDSEFIVFDILILIDKVLWWFIEIYLMAMF